MIPWSSFTSFNLNINNGGDFLLPIITGGKYSHVKEEIFLPVSLQIHHAVGDVYASKKNLPPSQENLMAMELCIDGLKNISSEVDYTMYHSLKH
jgi:chloramphenicol O-acetyltransferase